MKVRALVASLTWLLSAGCGPTTRATAPNESPDRVPAVPGPQSALASIPSDASAQPPGQLHPSSVGSPNVSVAGSSDAADAGSSDAADAGSSDAADDAGASAPPPAGGHPAPRVLVERPYQTWERRRSKGEVEAAGQDEALARWNLGGTGDPAFPSNRPGFHPGTRVIVNTRLLSGSLPKTAPVDRRTGKRRVVLSHVSLLARSRKHGYWPFRICFERAAQSGRKIKGGATLLRFKVNAAGKIRGVRLVRTKLEDREVAECLRARASEIELLPPPKQIGVELEVELWPGDVELPLLPASPSDARELDSKALHSVLSASEPAFAACYVAGLERDPALFGRVQLHTTLEPSGRVASVTQSESRFPDSAVTQCIARAVQSLQFPPRKSFSPSFEIGIRLGRLPGSSTP